MAATHNPLLSRTRSARVPVTNSVKATTSNSVAIPKSSNSRSTTRSNLSLFLTNLRLLDLDLLPDWPDINSSTFSNKDVAQGQKKRTQCVEWALYQLFVLWDPEDVQGMRNKLQPFFPPLDQVQSINLRAALLRCLEQAKKNGVLGRDAVLRKTMLDECRGERLEEILAVFSSAVLKKVAAEDQLRSNRYPPVAQTLALENRGYSGERAELDTLILAHKVSLNKKFGQKKASRAQYKDFAEVLDSKERSISRRREQLKTGPGQYMTTTKLSDDDKSNVRRAVRNNWSGNERWMDALFRGDTNSRKDGLLAAPFDRVWRRVQSNRLSELQDKGDGLLDQLDCRVRIHQERLSKWQNFRKEMFSDVAEEPRRKVNEQAGREKGINLGFGAHEGLHLGQISPRRLAGANPSGLEGEYSQLLEGLQTELRGISQGPAAPALGRLRQSARPLKSSTQSSSSEMVADEPVSELSEVEEELAKAYLPPPKRPQTISQRSFEERVDSDATSERPQKISRPKLPQPPSSMPSFRPKSRSGEISPTEPSKSRISPRPKAPAPRRSPAEEDEETSPSPTPTRSSARGNPPSQAWLPPRNSPPRTQSPEELPPSPTQQQADQILASMNAASPSPIKQPRPRHTLSLAERTRLSMTRGQSADIDDEDELGVGSPTRLRRRNTPSRSPIKGSKPTAPATVSEDATAAAGGSDPEEDDLVARTRKSMANFELMQEKVRLERERSQKRAARQQSMSNKTGEIARQSYFPALDEEESESAGGAGAGSGAFSGASGGSEGKRRGKRTSAVLEELMAQEAEMGLEVDYESIFKSRPKIKASPPGTPVREAFGWE